MFVVVDTETGDVPDADNRPLLAQVTVPLADWVIVIPDPADKLLYSSVVPAPTTPRTVLLEPTEVKPVPPLVEARVPET